MTSSLRGTFLRLFISFGAIGAIVYFMRDKIGESWVILRTDVLWSWFFIGLATYLVANLILAGRLLVVFKAHKIHLQYGQAVYLAFLGLFFNLFLPSAIGGDVAKIVFAAKYTGKKIESASAIFQDRLIGFVAIMAMAIIALAFVSREIADERVHKVVYLFVAIMMGTVLFFMSKRFAGFFSFLLVLIPSASLKTKLGEIYHAVYDFKNHPILICNSLVLAFLGQICFIVVHYFMARSLGIQMSVVLFFLIVPVVAIMSMMPSLGGLGVREAGIIFFLKHYMPPERALVLSMLLFLIIYGVSLAAGIVYAFRGGLKPQILSDLKTAGSA